MNLARNIALFCPSLNSQGGTETYLGVLVDLLHQEGRSVRIYTLDEAVNAAEWHGAKVTCCCPVLDESMRPLKWRKYAKERQELVAKIAHWADVFVFEGCAIYSVFTPAYNKMLPPVILNIHTSSLTCQAGTRYNWSSDSVCTRKPGVLCPVADLESRCLTMNDSIPLPMAQKLRSIIRRPMTSFLQKHCSGWIFNSQANRRLHESTIGPLESSAVIHPPVVTYSMSTQRAAGSKTARQQHETTHLVFAARLVQFKGLKAAIRLLARMKSNTVLHILGTGPEEKAGRQYAAQLGVSDRIEWLGWLPPDDLHSILGQADCLLHLSSCFETWGMTGPEALSQGCRVIAYDVGGVSEWCVGDGTAIVSAGDEQALYDGIHDLLTKNAPLPNIRDDLKTDHFIREYLAYIDTTLNYAS